MSYGLTAVCIVLVILLIRQRKTLAQAQMDIRQAKQFQSLALRLMEMDGAVPYVMRPGPTPQQDTYEHLAAGIESLVGVSATDIDHDAWVTLMQEVVPDDPKYQGDPGKYGEAFKIGRVQEYQVRIRVKLADGTEKWLSDKSLPLRHEVSGRIEGTLGLLREV